MSGGRPGGRPPDPPELRVLKGNPQKRPIRAPIDTEKPDGVPPYPPQLRSEGKKAWDLYWKYGAAWLANTDIRTITELCEIHDEETRIRRILDREGWFQRGDDPAVLTAKDTRELLVSVFDGDEPKADLVLYQLRQIAEKVGDNKSRPHPLVRVSHEIRARKLPLWIEAHLTPSSRGKANVKPKTADPLSEWAAK